MADYGNLKPDDELTDVFTKTVKDVAAEDYGAVKAGSNTALLLLLRLLHAEDPDAVNYHLSREGYDDLDDLQDAVRQRQSVPFVLDLSGVVDEDGTVSVDDSGFNAELQEPDDDGGE